VIEPREGQKIGPSFFLTFKNQNGFECKKWIKVNIRLGKAIFCLCSRVWLEVKLVFSLFVSALFHVPFACAFLILQLSSLS
jgi:hypothetical protein